MTLDTTGIFILILSTTDILNKFISNRYPRRPKNQSYKVHKLLIKAKMFLHYYGGLFKVYSLHLHLNVFVMY